MKNKDKLKQVDIKIFIIPVIIITFVFIIICHITIKGIKNYYYNHIKEDSLNLAKSYSHSLSKSAKATDVVNKLLEEKLFAASRTIFLYNEHNKNKTQKELEKLGEILNVDEIYYYNSQEEITNSNTGEFIRRKTYEYHPVHDLINSNSSIIIEDIRLEKETANYYKYGYFKTPDGRFVQIGVMADKIQSFLGAFEMQQILNEMQDVEVVNQIRFIDNDFKIIGSTDSKQIGQEISDKDVKAAILQDMDYSFINNNEKNEYEVFVPVYFERKKIGTLAIDKSLRDTEEIVRLVVTTGLAALICIYALLLYTMISTYKKNKKLIQIAYYDILTGLPNKQYLKEFLTEEIENNKGAKKAVLLINCNNFRNVNLTSGIEYGDETLKELSSKIKELVDDNKKLFRFSAGRFVLYVKDYNSQKDLILITNQIIEIFTNPFKIKNAEQHLRVQIGIVEINNKNNSFDKILKNALISLNHIKDKNSANYAFFNEIMENRLQREDLIERELRNALSEKNTKNLYLEFQPQVDLITNKIVAFEALARMKTESLGLISPIDFIDVAERKQLIIYLGNFILKEACGFINTIKVQGYNDVKVAVNVSGTQLLHKNFINTVLDIIKETNIEEVNLELEITESILLNNYNIVNEKLKNLREHKIEISLDDFGTGYSSFSRLGELNIDTVKIDKYFIDKILSKEDKEVITGDIISMSHKLGLKVVAEGVEIQEQRDFLKENHCDIMQGYIFSKPLLAKDAMKLLKITNTMPSQ